MKLERNKEEEILCILDKNGYIFPGFELVIKNGQLCLLGKGGFSAVYEMKSLNRLESQYALKVIGFEKHLVTSENFWDTVHLQQYLGEHTPYVCRLISAREIRILLDEEGKIQKVTNVTGERWDEDGLRIQFILMEKLEDIMARDRLGKVSLLNAELSNEEGVINFAFQVGQGLCCAHNHGILHRDVKLENVFWDELSQCYKLGDFGIAKFAVDGNAETVVYTDGYGAPEIERQLYDHYSATADIYSFGITLYLLLNDFKFPGSDGYYANMVQYDPEFVFPAPVHASVGMTRIIRKMCRFYQTDRYQSMAEVLMDLCSLEKEDRDQCEFGEMLDFETETYREEKYADSIDGQVHKIQLTGRAKRKEDEKIRDTIYTQSSVLYFFGFTILFALWLRSMQTDINVIYNWQFWVFLIAVAIEAILLSIKELHILFGSFAFVLGIYSCVSAGGTVPHILLLIGLIISIPVVTGACVVSIILWMGLILSGEMQWLEWIGIYDLSWILLVFIFAMLNRYMIQRIALNRTTYIRAQIGLLICDNVYLAMVVIGLLLLLLEIFGAISIPETIRKIHLIKTGSLSFILFAFYMYGCGYLGEDPDNKEENMYENEMDERGNGERSDTIK